MKIILLTNAPAPYRLPIYKIISQAYKDDFLVIFAAKLEENRSWVLTDFNFKHFFLKENIKPKKDGFNFIHNNPDVWLKLKEFDPDVIITTGFNPTHLYSWVFSVLYGKKHVCMTDGWLESEKHLSVIHRLVRRVVIKTSHAFIGASKNSLDLYRSYGAKEEKLFQSHLCIDNKHFKNNNSLKERRYDLMFSGQLTERKLPLFFAEIVKKVSKEIPNLKILILGDGPMKQELLSKLDGSGIDYHYAGFVAQEELPKYYSNARLFLLTTRVDAWGVVVNEALASGVPVLTTPYAGVVNDLLIDGQNGYVLEVDSGAWSSKVVKILNSPYLWRTLSQNAKESTKEFNFYNAANGIINACEYAKAK